MTPTGIHTQALDPHVSGICPCNKEVQVAQCLVPKGVGWSSLYHLCSITWYMCPNSRPSCPPSLNSTMVHPCGARCWQGRCIPLTLVRNPWKHSAMMIPPSPSQKCTAMVVRTLGTRLYVVFTVSSPLTATLTWPH